MPEISARKLIHTVNLCPYDVPGTFLEIGYVSEKNNDLAPYKVYTLPGEAHTLFIVFQKVTDVLEEESRVQWVGSTGLGMALLVF